MGKFDDFLKRNSLTPKTANIGSVNASVQDLPGGLVASNAVSGTRQDKTEVSPTSRKNSLGKFDKFLLQNGYIGKAANTGNITPSSEGAPGILTSALYPQIPEPESPTEQATARTPQFLLDPLSRLAPDKKQYLEGLDPTKQSSETTGQAVLDSILLPFKNMWGNLTHYDEDGFSLSTEDCYQRFTTEANRAFQLIQDAKEKYKDDSIMIGMLGSAEAQLRQLVDYAEYQRTAYQEVNKGNQAYIEAQNAPEGQDTSEQMWTYFSSLLYRPDFWDNSNVQHKEGVPYAANEEEVDNLDYGEKSRFLNDPNISGEDLLYEAINGNYLAAIKLASVNYRNNDIWNGLDVAYKNYAGSAMLHYHLTDGERAVFNYLYKTGGIDAAKEFLNTVAADLSTRSQRAYYEARYKEAAANPLFRSVEQIVSAPFKALINTWHIPDALDGQMTANSPSAYYSLGNQAVTDGAGDRIGSDFGNWANSVTNGGISAEAAGGFAKGAYGMGMGALTSLSRSAASFGNPFVLGAMVAGETFPTTVQEANSRGITGWQAATIAAIGTAAEIGTEYLQLDKLFNSPDLTKKTIVQYLLKNGISEGLEEMASEGIGLIADALIAADKSQFQERVNYHKADGKSDAAAWWTALGEMCLSVLEAGKNGFFSGLIAGGITSGFYYVTGNLPDAPDNMPLVQEAVLEEYRKRVEDASEDGSPLTAEQQIDIYKSVIKDLSDGKLDGYKLSAQEMAHLHNSYAMYLQFNKGLVNTAPTVPHAKSSSLGVGGMDDLIDASIAQVNGAPADPISAALDTVKNGGTVTNKQATDILNNTRAVRYLQEKVGLRLTDDRNGGTASSRRAAVKEAVAKLATMESIDTTAQTGYDNQNTTGGNNYADAGQPELSRTSEAGLPGGTGAQWLRGTDPQQIPVPGSAPGGVEARSQMGQGSVDAKSGESGFEVQLRVSPILRISDNLSAAQQQSGIQIYPVRDTSAQPQVYADALNAARNANSANGWCVTPKTAQELQQEGIRTFMNDTGTVGAGIAPNGDIVAVFKNKNGGPPRALDTIMPIAIEQGGNRLDCYGEGLVRTYENYGFIPVARVEFNSEYANDGWTADKGTPYIYFMMHNGESANRVASNIRNYPHATQEQLDTLPTYGKNDYDAAMAYRDGLLDGNSEEAPATHGLRFYTAKVNPTTSVGAAPADFSGKSGFNDLLREGNVQPDRPGDVRPMEIPKTDAFGRHVSELAANAYGAKVTPDSAADQIQELIAMGALGFDTKSNKKLLQDAAADIKKHGMDASENAVKKAAFDGKTKDSDIAKAMILYAAYANRNSDFAQSKAAELMVGLATMANNAGRNLQLFKLLRKMTPQGQLLAVERGISQAADKLNRRRSKAHQIDPVIPQELAQEYLAAAELDLQEQSAESAKAKEDIEKTIYKSVAAQIDATLMEKLNAWRYMAMLGNVKTQARNFIGNAAFRPLVNTKRVIGAALESVFLEQDQRTKAVLGTGAESRALMAWAKEDAKTQTAEDMLSYCAQTGDAARSGIEENRRIYDTKWLESVRKFVQAVPEGADMLFKKREYSVALASFLKARGCTSESLSSGTVDADILSAARTYATQEALKATFNDHNVVSDFLSRRLPGDNSFEKAMNILAEGVLPFRRTPANILVRGMEYSPLQLVKSVTTDLRKLRSGEITGAQYIDGIASCLTGTAALALGYALSAGIFGFRLRGRVGDEDEKRQGHQAYAIEFGGKSYTIDWLAPTNLPLFVGANLYDSLHGKADVGWFISIIDAAISSLEPMLELSCLSSLNDLIESSRYAEEGTALWTLAATAATSYLKQYIPAIFGQFEQATEGEKKGTYSDADTPLERAIEKAIGSATQKIPGLDLYQAQKYDPWGRPVETSGFFEGLFSPSYSSTIVDDPVEQEIARLNAAQSTNVSPSLPSQTITVDGETIRLSANQYETLCKSQGETQRRLVEEILASEGYGKLTDEQKAAAISKAYDYARELAKSSIGIDGSVPAYIKNRPEGMSEAEAILRQTVLGNTADYADIPIDVADDVIDLLDGLTVETKPDGSSYSNVRPVQKMEAIVENDDLDPWVEQLLPIYMDQNTQKRYEIALGEGYTSDQFVAAYRIYLDRETGESKQQLIRQMAAELNISYPAAKSLYEIYSTTPQ